MTADMVASGVTYSYLDWLVGDFDSLPLEELLSFFEETLSSFQAACKGAISRTAE